MSFKNRKVRVEKENIDVGNKMYPIMKNSKTGEIYGYMNESGKVVIEPRFEVAYDVNKQGIGIVSEKNMWGGINSKNEYVIKPIFESISPFKDCRAIFVLNGTMGALDENGNIITRKNYSFINDFNDNRAVVGVTDVTNSYKYGFIDEYGRCIVPPKFIEANNFTEGVALVKLKDKEFALINKDGEFINIYNYEYVSQYGSGLMVFAETSQGPYGYINKMGKVVIKPIYSEAQGFKDNVAIVSKDEKYNGPYGVINLKGDYIFEPIYSDIKSLGENKIALGLPLGSNKDIGRSIYAIGDTSGKILTEFNYLVVGEYHNGLAYASDKESTFFIDSNGGKNNSLPTVKGSGELSIKDNIVFANIDYSPYYLTKSSKIIYEPNKVIPLDKKYSVVKEKYKPNINYLIYNPQVKGVTRKKIENEINIKLKEMSYFNGYGEDVKEPVKINIDDVLDYNYYGNFQIEFFKKNLLVLNLTGYYYGLGAAHGIPSRKTPSIDLVTGKFYTLGDLFMGGVYWTGELNKIIENMIKTDSKYNEIFPGAFKGIDVNQNFYIDEENLYIYFAPYDIGPYAAGFITFKIPFTEINGMINKNGDFYKSFN